MAATEKTLAEKIIEAVGRKHPDLLKDTKLVNDTTIKELIEASCKGIEDGLSVINDEHTLDIQLGNGHIATIADHIGEAYNPVLEQAKKLATETNVAKKAEIEGVLTGALNKAGKKVGKAHVKMLAKDFDLPDTFRKAISQTFGIEANELERAGFVSRLFKEGEKLRPGRVGAAAAVGAAAVGGAAYLLTRKKEVPQAVSATNWTAKVEAAKDNAPERSV